MTRAKKQETPAGVGDPQGGPENTELRGEKRDVNGVVKHRGESADSFSSLDTLDIPENDLRALIEFLGSDTDRREPDGPSNDLAVHQELAKSSAVVEAIEPNKGDDKLEMPAEIPVEKAIDPGHDAEMSLIEECGSNVSEEAQFGDSESDADSILVIDKTLCSDQEAEYHGEIEDENKDENESGIQFQHQFGFQDYPSWEEADHHQEDRWNEFVLYGEMDPSITSSVMGDCGSFTAGSIMTESMVGWYTDPVLTALPNGTFSEDTLYYEPESFEMFTPVSAPSQQFLSGGYIWVDRIDFDEYDHPVMDVGTSSDVGQYAYEDDPAENQENTAPDNNVIHNLENLGEDVVLSEPISVTQNGTGSWTDRYSGAYNQQRQFIPFGPLRPVPRVQGHVPSVNVSSHSQRTFAHEWYSEVASHIRDVNEDPMDVVGAIRNGD